MIPAKFAVGNIDSSSLSALQELLIEWVCKYDVLLSCAIQHPLRACHSASDNWPCKVVCATSKVLGGLKRKHRPFEFHSVNSERQAISATHSICWFRANV
jgi:hypothetical protein|mmetsp:Transcript_27418/g.46531  ORF Transcript_27418/g.46531 Transcript_27418/m.46531 type:complete len:100 (-) Transcript_27418:744-1043(-)